MYYGLDAEKDGEKVLNIHKDTIESIVRAMLQAINSGSYDRIQAYSVVANGEGIHFFAVWEKKDV